METSEASTRRRSTGFEPTAHAGRLGRDGAAPLPSGHALRRDPRDVPCLLRGARPPAPEVRLPRPGVLRPLGPAHDGRHAPAEAVLPGRRAGAAPPADLLSEV